jgi:hypothetical protein
VAANVNPRILPRTIITADWPDFRTIVIRDVGGLAA